MSNAPNHILLDAILNTEKLKNDAALAKHLGMQPPQISKIRHGRIPVTDTFRVIIMRKLGWSLKRVDTLAPPDA